MAKVKPVEFYGLLFYNTKIDEISLLIYNEWGNVMTVNELLRAHQDNIDGAGLEDAITANLSDDYDMQWIMEDAVHAGFSGALDEDENGFVYYDTGMTREVENSRGNPVEQPVWVYIVNEKEYAFSAPELFF